MKWHFPALMLFTFIFILTPSLYADMTYLPETIREDIDDYVLQNEETNAGAAIALFDSDEVIFQNYYGYKDIEKEAEVSEDTVFEWGSVSKLFVWISVMQLWEEGELDLDTDVRNYLPDDLLTGTVYDDDITLTHLMNHEAGFQENLANLYVNEIDEEYSLHQALVDAEPVQIYEPGTVSAYSNYGVALAAMVVEEISGEPFDDYVNENIFTPLGMTETAVSIDASDNEWVDRERDSIKTYSATGAPLGENRKYIPLYPAGSAIGTMNDFVKFGRALLPENDGDGLFDNAETLMEMYEPTKYLADSEVPYNSHGFWVEIFETPVIGHAGNTSGFSAFLRMDVENDMAYAVMTNQANETTYNYLLAEEIFGSAEDSEYSGFLTEPAASAVRMARTIKEGAQKFMSMLITPLSAYEPDKNVMVPFKYEGRTYYAQPYFDIETVGLFELIVILSLYLLFIVSIVYSFITLTIGGLITRPFRNKRSNGRTKHAFNKWHYMGNGLALIIFINFIVYLQQITGFEPVNTYVWQLWLFFILLLLLPVYIIYYCLKLWSARVRKKTYFKYGMTLVAMLSALYLILYLNLYQFWAI